jgi:hypothetical protein
LVICVLAMSFVSVEASGLFTRDRALKTGPGTSFRELMFSDAGRSSRGKNHAETGMVTKVALAIILVLSACVLGLAVYGPPASVQTALRPLADLHPTCSPEHDCWIAAPKKQETSSAFTEGPPQAREARNRDNKIVSSSADTAQFGTLVLPRGQWSGPPLTAGTSVFASSPPAQMQAVAAPPAPGKVRLASKKAKTPKSRPVL